MNTNWNDPNFQGFGGRQSPFGKRPPRPKKEHKAIGTPLSRTLINLAVTLIFAAVYFYVVLPPINLQAEEFYLFMLLCCAVYCGCAVLTSGFQGSGAKGYFGFVKKQCRIPVIIAVALVAVAAIALGLIIGGVIQRFGGKGGWFLWASWMAVIFGDSLFGGFVFLKDLVPLMVVLLAGSLVWSVWSLLHAVVKN